MIKNRLFSYAVIIFLISNQILVSPKIRDFKNMSELAQKWGEKTYKDWVERKITRVEKKALFDYTGNYGQEINQYLKASEGVLITDKNNNSVKTKNIANDFDCDLLNKKIKMIDSALLKAKTPETIMVYRRVKENQFNLPLGILRQNDSVRINSKIVQEIIDEFQNQKKVIHSYLSTSLVNQPHHFTFHNNLYPILLKIVVPRYFNAAYLRNISYFENEIEMLIHRNYHFKYNHFAIVHEKSRESLHVEISLHDE